MSFLFWKEKKHSCWDGGWEQIISTEGRLSPLLHLTPRQPTSHSQEPSPEGPWLHLPWTQEHTGWKNAHTSSDFWAEFNDSLIIYYKVHFSARNSQPGFREQLSLAEGRAHGKGRRSWAGRGVSEITVQHGPWFRDCVALWGSDTGGGSVLSWGYLRIRLLATPWGPDMGSL